MNTKKHLIKIEYLRPGDQIPPVEDGTLYVTNSPELAGKLTLAGYPTAAHSYQGGSPGSSFDGIRYVLEDIDELVDEDYERIYRRLKNLPWDILETDRLLVRETTVEDVETLVELYSDPSTTEFMENLFPIDEEKEYLRKYIENIYGFYEIGIWSLIRIEDNALIGRIGIEYTDEEGIVEMGFMLGVDYQGLGYATEAGAAIIEYANAYPYINAVHARVHKNNHASTALCKRMGFVALKEDNETSLVTWEYKLRQGKN